MRLTTMNSHRCGRRFRMIADLTQSNGATILTNPRQPPENGSSPGARSVPRGAYPRGGAQARGWPRAEHQRRGYEGTRMRNAQRWGRGVGAPRGEVAGAGTVARQRREPWRATGSGANEANGPSTQPRVVERRAGVGVGRAVTREGGEENYNIFRWYRAGWGRYTQSDPIGLTRKNNLYSYTFGNPLTWIDPTGLAEYEPLPDCGKLPCGACCAARHQWGQEASEHTFHYSHLFEVGATAAGVVAGAAEGWAGAAIGGVIGFGASYGYLTYLQIAAEAAIRREYEHCLENCRHNNLTACQSAPPQRPSPWHTPPTAGGL